MWYLDKDILYLIFEEIKNDKKTLHSCLLVNRTWCVTAAPLLWKNPWKYVTIKSKILLFNVIISHLSKESRDILKNQGINNLITETYQRPLFNYIYFCKYLSLFFLENEISSKNFEKSKMSIIRNEILKLFINGDKKYIHISIPDKFDCQLHHITGFEHCFSELESFYCRGNIDQNVIEGLAKVCKSIKSLSVGINSNNFGIFKLIEVQKNLNIVNLIHRGRLKKRKESFNKSLEESLIKHANTIQYLRIEWKPITRFLSYFVNLLNLEIYLPYNIIDINQLENISLPNLKTLRTRRVTPKVLANLIENTKGNLTEISVLYSDRYDNSEMFIQAIYQNCPNLKYFHLSLINNSNSLISEFENLLISCQFLSGLVINVYDEYYNKFSWDNLLLILAKSSPISLFKFKFFSSTIIKLFGGMVLFFDNWKDRNPILIRVGVDNYIQSEQMNEFINEYKMRGIVEKYSIGFGVSGYENFEWV
ncbi:hypothetical protein RhiirA1_454357 [Rhizophagus irregularis]|uniref:Uncharacterized protein n=5 Tax=Rhizophagus irregularis TaxID=588596 RepID=A0A2I1EHF1_9GLOM|nr:hypothetical protein GLOIN_2v1789114 [Rhizophagus irregularis DAOM 181602=DAOM 197198]PKC70756.1 hypothetical protein RhiirA1_454357 [Rhizophagus irregularis]PKY21551.1 hypothetical protein RhiirB3_435186 [Rhizophagus irregularis]POG59458.1 hypothetical protein GLOIN_2v1789114 [Rhizophagus irregularis DAOM 181602=DAOM 197198]GBC45424.2 hypothetical protein GLOIN_2v1789114 [Rhizophagus irregularis DAOM 181602=DAOM 197198]|eukprot:XP_025166324.1 hypothetical protein GLOIN_2v1789114 [Rhizophagus irregularis DAOM 181602=DAOM 197198]